MKMQGPTNLSGASALDTSNSKPMADNKSAAKIADGGGGPDSGNLPIDTGVAASTACPSQYPKC